MGARVVLCLVMAGILMGSAAGESVGQLRITLVNDEYLYFNEPGMGLFISCFDHSTLEMAPWTYVDDVSTYDDSSAYVENIDWGGAYGNSRYFLAGDAQHLYARDNSFMRITGSFYTLIITDSAEVEIDSPYGSRAGLVLQNGGVCTVSGAGSDVTVENGEFFLSGGTLDVLSVLAAKAQILEGSLLELYCSGRLEMSGGHIQTATVRGAGVMHIIGGTVASLHAIETATVLFYSDYYLPGAGLWMEDNRIMGTGTLFGKAADGSIWQTTIVANDPQARILAMPLVPPPLEADLSFPIPAVYQNAPNMTGNRHAATLTVQVTDDGGYGNSSYGMIVEKIEGPGDATVTADPLGNPLHTLLVGPQWQADGSGCGTSRWRITVVGNIGGSCSTEVTLDTRRLGDVDGNGFVEPTDKARLNAKLNGVQVPAGVLLFDIDGNGFVEPLDKARLNSILNGIPVQ